MATHDPMARLSTGVTGLDTMIGGGIPAGDATLVAGAPGTGKTTFGMHFAAQGVAHGEPAVFLSFEYLPQQLYRDAGLRGWDLHEWEERDEFRLLCTTPDVLLSQLADGQLVLDDAIREIGATRLVLDSMTHFQHMGEDAETLRSSIAGLMNHLRLSSVTSIMTHEIPQIAGPTVTISDYGLEFLVDNVVLLRYVELEGELHKAINVLKFRGGDHDRAYRAYRLTGKGMEIDAPFTGVENITGGSAHRSFEQRAREVV